MFNRKCLWIATRAARVGPTRKVWLIKARLAYSQRLQTKIHKIFGSVFLNRRDHRQDSCLAAWLLDFKFKHQNLASLRLSRLVSPRHFMTRNRRTYDIKKTQTLACSLSTETACRSMGKWGCDPTRWEYFQEKKVRGWSDRMTDVPQIKLH